MAVQYFNSHAVESEPWLGPAVSKSSEAIGDAFPQTWRTDAAGARAECTLRVVLRPDAAICTTEGYFTSDVEIFVLSGALNFGDTWLLKKHGYTFIPAGVCVGPISTAAAALGRTGVEFVWMENGPAAALHVPSTEHTPAGAARLGEFVAPLDSFYVPWSAPSTAQFSGATKKWLRRAPNGGGCWLLNVCPHYDAPDGVGAIQNYNAEATGLTGYMDNGAYRFLPGMVGYVPTGAVSPFHSSVDGGLFFLRIDRDLAAPHAVVSVNEMPAVEVDWSVEDSAALPGPAVGVIPVTFLKHIGTWEGSYTHIGSDGQVLDRHECRLEIGMHGEYYSQRNTYVWRDADGNATKTEVKEFPGKFDRDGVAWIESERIAGWGRSLDVHGTVLFYGAYKVPPGAGPAPDTFDLLRIFNKEGTHRYRTWQVKSGEKLLKLVHVDERRVSDANEFWIPRFEHGKSLAEKLEAKRAPDFML